MPKSRILFVVFAIVICMLTKSVIAQTEVRIIGYPFPPFVVDQTTGLTPGLVNLLNKTQSEYNFTFAITSPNRRYRAFKQGTGDLILFEMSEWGWKSGGIAFEETRRIFIGGEVFIAKATPGRNQVYFESLSSKQIIAYNGYHYGFAEFNADHTWLKQNFDITLTNSHETNIRVILAGRADVSVITQSFLNQYLHINPQFRSKLLVSKKMDQVYRLGAVVRKNGPITAGRLELILNKLKKSGELKEFVAKYGLGSHLIY